MMSVDFAFGGRLPPSRPRKLFEGSYAHGDFDQPDYDVSPDGRFLMVEPTEASEPTRIMVVLNWLPRLQRLVSGAR